MNVNSSYQFIDTNILVYAHDRSADKKHERAIVLVNDLWRSGNGCLSIQVLQEFYVTITRKASRPLPTAVAAQLVADLGTWHIHEPGVEDVLMAIQLQDRYKISFWDAMIIQSATKLGCRTLWTEDLNDGQTYQRVRVQNPLRNT